MNLDWLCYLGFHKKVTAEEKITDMTSNYTEYCKRCGIILDKYGCTTFSFPAIKIKLEQEGTE